VRHVTCVCSTPTTARSIARSQEPRAQRHYVTARNLSGVEYHLRSKHLRHQGFHLGPSFDNARLVMGDRACLVIRLTNVSSSRNRRKHSPPQASQRRRRGESAKFIRAHKIRVKCSRPTFICTIIPFFPLWQLVEYPSPFHPALVPFPPP